MVFCCRKICIRLLRIADSAVGQQYPRKSHAIHRRTCGLLAPWTQQRPHDVTLFPPSGLRRASTPESPSPGRNFESKSGTQTGQETQNVRMSCTMIGRKTSCLRRFVYLCVFHRKRFCVFMFFFKFCVFLWSCSLLLLKHPHTKLILCIFGVSQFLFRSVTFSTFRFFNNRLTFLSSRHWLQWGKADKHWVRE